MAAEHSKATETRPLCVWPADCRQPLVTDRQRDMRPLHPTPLDVSLLSHFPGTLHFSLRGSGSQPLPLAWYQHLWAYAAAYADRASQSA